MHLQGISGRPQDAPRLAKDFSRRRPKTLPDLSGRPGIGPKSSKDVLGRYIHMHMHMYNYMRMYMHGHDRVSGGALELHRVLLGDPLGGPWWSGGAFRVLEMCSGPPWDVLGCHLGALGGSLVVRGCL